MSKLDWNQYLKMREELLSLRAQVKALVEENERMKKNAEEAIVYLEAIRALTMVE